MINVHTHIFTTRHVPVNFLPWFIKPIANFAVKKWMVNLLRIIGLKSSSYLVNKFLNFKKIGELKSQEEIFKHLSGFYPSETGLVALSMDMEYMGAGKVPEPYDQQLDDLVKLKNQYPNDEYPYSIHPFIFAHPERPNILDLVKEHIEEHNFSGIKLYPALGYFPYDPRLEKVYEYAETNQIPVMTHCTRGGVYYQGRLTKERRTDPRTNETYPKKSNKDFTDIYSDPNRYIELLNDFPKLKLCFAHFGGAGEWDTFLSGSWHDKAKESWFWKVKEIVCNENWNTYTDVSYTLSDPKYYATLKSFLSSNERLRKRVLFGSDYYMTEQEVSERAFGINLSGFLGDTLWHQIADTNPQTFLNSKINQL
ncbi:MAG: putative TIM-barrel fold metal-dependent hydrolase [Salibacteraceae bacterium]|jgi:predicted TIM-barrel fold metal-dependent hydrolase